VAAEAEFPLGFEDRVVRGRLSKVGFGDGEDVLAQGEEVVAGRIVDALAR
jgi:hypothetical protein